MIGTPQYARPAVCTKAAEKRTAGTSASAAPPEVEGRREKCQGVGRDPEGEVVWRGPCPQHAAGYTGTIRVEFLLDTTPLRCILRVMEALQEEDTFGLDELEPERELATLKRALQRL